MVRARAAVCRRKCERFSGKTGGRQSVLKADNSHLPDVAPGGRSNVEYCCAAKMWRGRISLPPATPPVPGAAEAAGSGTAGGRPLSQA